MCRAALARIEAGPSKKKPGDDDIYNMYELVLKEFDMRLHGASPDPQTLFTRQSVDVNEALGAKLAKTFNKLSMSKREKLWSAGTSWLKLIQYMPKIIEQVIEGLILQVRPKAVFTLNTSFRAIFP